MASKPASKQTNKQTNIKSSENHCFCVIPGNHCFCVISDALESSHNKQASKQTNIKSSENHCFCVISENHCFCVISDTLESSHNKQAGKPESTQTFTSVRITVFVWSQVHWSLATTSKQANTQAHKHQPSEDHCFWVIWENHCFCVISIVRQWFQYRHSLGHNWTLLDLYIYMYPSAQSWPLLNSYELET